MGRRYYRRKGSMAGQMLRDTVDVSNVLPWWGVALLTGTMFAAFYWLLPWWIESRLANLQGNLLAPMIESLFGRRIHWFQYLAIVIGLIGAFFTVKNYLSLSRLSTPEQREVGWFSRLLARLLD